MARAKLIRNVHLYLPVVFLNVRMPYMVIKKVCLCLCKNKPWLDENLNFNTFHNNEKINKKVSSSTELLHT